MPSVRESALAALFSALQTVSGPTIKRNESDLVRIPAGGLVNLEDGDPGEPEITLSPKRYSYQHRAEIVVLVQAATADVRDSLFDQIGRDIGAALTADVTLGGAVEHLEVEAPETEGLPIEGAESVKGAILPVLLFYTTANPLD